MPPTAPPRYAAYVSDCGCSSVALENEGQRRTLRIALALNTTMFMVETTGGIIGHSSGLIADGLDMLADAFAYGIALAAVGRGIRFKANSATVSGSLLLLLGWGVLADVVRRLLSNERPEGWWMIGVAALALVVNATVLRLLSKQRQDVHIRATRIFTQVDVVANGAVICAGVAVLLTGVRYIDLAVGTGIGIYVIKEAIEILRDARTTRRATRQP